jgi:hypothetical protein
MPSFLAINGLEVCALVDSGFTIESADIRTTGVAADGTRQGAFVLQKFAISFSTDYLESDVGVALRDWISGRGHQWSFTVSYNGSATASLSSDDGGLKFTGATTGNTSAKFGNHHLIVHPSGSGVATATFGASRNWSVGLWHRPHGGSWDFYAVTYDGTETYWTATGTTSSMFPFFTITDTSETLVLTLQGENTAGSSATASYDSVRILPYALTSDMIDALVARTAELPTPPFVYIEGSCLPDYADEIQAEGVVKDTTLYQAVVGSPTVFQSAKQLKVSLLVK